MWLPDVSRVSHEGNVIKFRVFSKRLRIALNALATMKQVLIPENLKIFCFPRQSAPRKSTYINTLPRGFKIKIPYR